MALQCRFADRVRHACALVALLTIPPAHGAPDDNGCRIEVGRVVSRQGSVEVRRATGDWVPAKHEYVLCDGDAVRTGRHARAALYIRPENIVRLDQNTAVTLHVTDAETLIEFFGPGLQRTTADPDCGAAYFVSRFPRRFKVRTHYVNAEIEGTEFLVRAACEATTVAVYEGAVRTTELATDRTVLVKALEQLTTGPAYQGSIPVRIQPRDGVQWTIHYPRLSGHSATAGDPQAVCATSDNACEIAQAEALLAAGRADDAQSTLQRLGGERDADALALEAIVRIARNERDEALALAQSATQASPGSNRAWSALSYARQAKLDLEGALAAAREARRLASANALASARVAELLMTTGDLRAASREADRAVALDPGDARAMTVRGFARLGQLRAKEAQADFLAAIEIDSTEPLARLGLGLAKVREGQLEDGRRDIEIAVALDPTSSVNRTYLGKAYFEESATARDRLASEQFRMAAALDPNDPTPRHYDALLALAEGRSGDASRSAMTAVRLNGNRAVLRDEGLLEQDAAARSATLARVYQELGFDALALSAGYQSLLDDPRQASGHRFLADAYLAQPRHEVARASEMLQAQIRQPLMLHALQPQLSDDRFTSTRGAGPVTSGIAEFNPSFIGREGIAGVVGGSVGEHGTSSQQIMVGVLKERMALSGAVVRQETDGYRPSADSANELRNILAQYRFTPTLSAQVEFRRSDLEQGDPYYRFDPNLFRDVRSRQQSDVGRLGLRQEITPDLDVVASFIYSDSRETVDMFGMRLVDITSVTKSSEAQVAGRATYVRAVGGLSLVEEASLVRGLFGADPASPRSKAGYLYSTLTPPIAWGRLFLQLGVSQEVLESAEEFGTTRRRTNPKLGAVFETSSGWTLRAAYFENMKRYFYARQTLEPTQVAGFNQFFDEYNGTISKRRGLGIDRKIGETIFAGIEVSRRDLSVPFNFSTEIYEWRERRAAAYLYWSGPRKLSLRAGWEYERLVRDVMLPGNEVFFDAATRIIPVAAQIGIAPGLTLSAQTSRVAQDGLFYYVTTPGPDPEPGASRFWITDVALQYRLPSRAGVLRLELRNAFDRHFAFQETDFRMTRFARERTLIGSLTLTF